MMPTTTPPHRLLQAKRREASIRVAATGEHLAATEELIDAQLGGVGWLDYSLDDPESFMGESPMLAFELSDAIIAHDDAVAVQQEWRG